MKSDLCLCFLQLDECSVLCLVDLWCWKLVEFQNHICVYVCVFNKPIVVWGFETSFSNPLRERGGIESLSVSKQLG